MFPAGTTSLLSKNLTRGVWDQLKDARDAQGVSFKQGILSGCQNVDSGIGVYAGSHDSYSTFSALFDPIIEQYHGHRKGDVHTSDMDHTKLNCPPFAAADAAKIKSTRIRVGRNLDGIPLGPGISKD
jgi:creatine kinase/arginine kinase